MQAAVSLAALHNVLVDTFGRLAHARGELPVFAIEHGLDEVALDDLRRTVSRHLEEDPQLSGSAWSRSYLPLVVMATEVGYRYRGTGTDFWPVLSKKLGIEAGPAFRSGLSRLFELGHRNLRLFQPGDSDWERHFPHISWPIGNSVVPIEIQPQLTDALRRAVRAGVSADDTEGLLAYIRALAAGHSSRRFDNFLIQRDVALEVMRRLLAPDSTGWLSEDILLRIDRDIRKDWGAFRAITEARKTIAKKSARLAQVTRSRYVLALRDGTPTQLAIRGPVLPSQMREEVIAALRIHGDRIKAFDGIQAISLSSFLAGGEIALKSNFPFPVSPLRRDDAIEIGEGTANTTMERLQPIQPEFFAFESNSLMAHAVFPEDKLQPDSRIIQFIRRDNGSPEPQLLDFSTRSDSEFLRRRGFVIAEQSPKLQLFGLPAAGYTGRFLTGFPVLVAPHGADTGELLLDGSIASGQVMSIRSFNWKVLWPDIGRHFVQPADGRELDRLEFEVTEPPDLEPAAVKVFPANANVSDLMAGRIEIRIAAPLALEAIPIRIRVISPNDLALVSEDVIERLPARITGHAPILRKIQTHLSTLPTRDSGLRLSIEVEGLLANVISLQPIRRELRYDLDSGKWRSSGDDGRVLSSIGANVVSPLLHAAEHDQEGTHLVLPDAHDLEALAAGIILPGKVSPRLALGERSSVSIPELLREPTSSVHGVGLIDLVRANVAWQLAEANDLLSNWKRWTVVEELEAALIEQLCGAMWRRLETGIDLSILSTHGAFFRSAEQLSLVSGKDLPAVETPADRKFLRDRLIFRFCETVPDVQESLLRWNSDVGEELDLAVIRAYEDLRQHMEASGLMAFEEVDMSRPAETWRKALESSRELSHLPMFRPLILPEARWLALIKPIYASLSEDDLVDLLDSIHTDAFRRPGMRWLGRSELRTMLQLWLSPKTLIETEGWRELLAKGLSDIQTSRAIRYVALRRKLALGDVPDRNVN